MKVVLSIRQAWEHSLHREGHERDAAQERIVALLEQVEQQLLAADRQSSGLLARFRRERPRAVRGLYIWGGVGRGKTFLMDLFFETLAIDAKKRIHFHRMMHNVHTRLASLGEIEDPLDRVAADIAGEIRVLCFDEFFVSDIGDAMILTKNRSIRNVLLQGRQGHRRQQRHRIPWTHVLLLRSFSLSSVVLRRTYSS